MIQQTCISPEKNNSTKRFFEPILHLVATNILRISTHLIKYLDVVTIIIKRGAIFCHVRNTNDVFPESFVIRLAPQKWKGAILVLRSNPSITQWVNGLLHSAMTPPLNIISVPILWTMKYIMPVFFAGHLTVIIIKNDIKFNSNIIHEADQISVEIAPSVPIRTPVHIC